MPQSRQKNDTRHREATKAMLSHDGRIEDGSNERKSCQRRLNHANVMSATRTELNDYSLPKEIGLEGDERLGIAVLGVERVLVEEL